ncbi:hypothetical protein D8827_05710 [Streptococcus intermedius]|uniref:Tail spike domain-containing protein n=1 Tax=Streptococcus intermedius TaxID=1338 RepID=A0AAE8KBK5_STRIT|nr:phage tail spike protein [Streptococcus intermedius]RSJ23148.1 hypothetical protein D8827_05710 [Streptococcus intermedius]
MLFLLDRGVKTVKWNGIPLHEANSAIVKEEQNGDFTLNVRYPITDSGIYQLIKEDMLIKAPAPVLGPQLFRIKKPIENNDHLEIQAYHITDDVMKRSVKPLKVVNLSCAMALSQMVQNAKADIQDFSFTSDIWDKRTFNTTEDDTLYSILLDGKHSIVGTWEGELVRDNFALTVKKNRGTNRGVIITTHKNLKSYQRTKDSQNVVTRIYAKSTFKAEGAEQETTLKVTVDSPLINSYPYVNEKEYENNNAKTVDELRQWAEAKFKNEGIDKSSDAIKIEAYELDGQVVHMGDTVNIKSRKHNVDLYKKAVAYEFDCLANNGKGAYISITFDDKLGIGGSKMSNGLSAVANEILEIGNSAQEIATERALRNADKAFEAEFEKQKSLINDGIEQAKAKAEEVKSEINQSIEQKLQQTKSEVVEKVKQDFNQGLANANSEIGKVKQDLTNLQSSSETTITQLKSDLTSQLGDKASKSEVKQTADGIREEISHLSTASRNYILNSDMTTSIDRTTGTGLPLSSDLIRTLNAERSFTLSVDVIAQNMVAKNDKKRFGISYELKFSDGSNLWTEVFQTSDTALARISKNFVLPAGKQIVSIAGGLYFQAAGQIKLSRPKWGIGHNNKEWIKAVEDTDEQITAARTTFEKTAEGLKTDMAAVKSYVADDGKRREQLEQYTRTETARSAEALRKQASESYVAKSQYSEDAKGVARRFEELNLNGTNLLPNTDFKNLIDVGNQFTVGGKTYKVKTLDKWYSSYNDGIPNPKTNYHGYFNETKFTETVFEFNESNGVREWKGLPIFITNDSRYTVGKYIFSADVNATGEGTHLEVGFYYYNKTGMREFHAGRARKNITSVNSWSRISLELKINDDVDFAKEMGFYIYGYGFTSNSALYFKRPKLTNTNWTPSVEDNKKYTETKIAEYKQTVDGEFKKIQSSVGEMVKKTDINITPGQISFGTGKVVNGKTIASFFVQNPESIEAITKLMRITGDLVVNGSITGQNLASKTITTANLAAGSVTTEVLAADAVTAKNMRVDYALINKLTADDVLLNNLVAKQAFINKLSTIDFSATQIKGGILKSLNGNTSFDLSSGTLEFYTDDPAIRRVTGGFPNQFVKFATGVSGGRDVGVTVIGSNRWGSENSNDGGFVGVRAWNGNGVDLIDVVGDTVRLASSAYESADGWDVITLPDRLEIDAHNANHRASSRVKVGDVWLWQDISTYSSLRDTINLIIDNLRLLHNNKTTETGYSYTLPAKV